jgi:hypothetical protein
MVRGLEGLRRRHEYMWTHWHVREVMEIDVWKHIFFHGMQEVYAVLQGVGILFQRKKVGPWD